MAERQRIANRYEIISTLGQGGMGDVFRGRDLQTGQMVAIKLLKPDIVDMAPMLIERFEREGEALRQLNHPNIVKMLDSINEEGLHYLIMEYVPGGSLADLLKQQPQLPIARVLEIALDLADALTRAHRLQIIHRDLKPSNVLLAEDGTPRLADFGVARLASETRVTETGALIGTYAYLSPEACQSSGIDTRTDIWSFGVMLYEMLAGQHPFEREHGPATLIAILNDPVPDLFALRPDVPPALAQLIYQMLEKDRDQRIPSVRQVGAELEALMYGLDTPLRPAFAMSSSVSGGGRSRFASTPSVAQRGPVSAARAASAEGMFSSRVRRWLLPVGIVAVLLIAAVVLAAALGVLDGGEKDGDSGIASVAPVQPGEYMVLVAQLQPRQEAGDYDPTQLVVDDLTARLEQEIPFSSIRIRAYPRVIETQNEALEASEANDAVAVVWGTYTPDQIELNIQVGVTSPFPYLAMGRDILEHTANVRVEITDPLQQSAALQVLTVINVLLTADGSGYQVARTVAILDALDIPSYAPIVSGGVGRQLQTSVTHYLDDTQNAIENYDAAIDLQPGNPLLYVFRGTAYIRLGERDKALRDLETAQRLGPENWAAPLYVLGLIAPDVPTALEYYDRIITLRPNDWFAHNYRGALYYLQGDYEQARAEYEQALALGPDANFPYVASIVLALREGRFADAAAMKDAVVTKFPDPGFSARLIQAIVGDQVDNIFAPLFAAIGHMILGQYEDVLRDAERALAINDQLADIYLLQGVAYCSLDDAEAAEAAYTRAIELEPDYKLLYALRCQIRLDLGDRKGSLDDLAVAQDHTLGPEFDALLQAGLSGELTCKTFFDYDFSQLATGQPASQE